MTTATKVQLTEADLAALAHESWIDAATAEQFGLSRVTSTDGAALVGRTDREDYSGIVFPTYWPGDPAPKECFLRRDHPSMEHDNGRLKPRQKYLAPPGRGNRLLFGPNETADALDDVHTPVLLVEGLKKHLAAYRLARYGCTRPRFLACGVTGVYNWRGTIGKTTGSNGARVSIKGPIGDLSRVSWQGRDVLLIFDSDAATNPRVAQAREAFAEELRLRGADVLILHLPTLDGLAKTGFDDLCAAWGPDRVLEWIEQAEAIASATCEDPEPISIDALPIPAFPANLVPADWLRAQIQGVATATETPIELAALLGLAVVATTVQKKFAVEPELGYVEPLNLWTCPALDSGNRKTAVLKEMTQPLLDYERVHAAAIAQDILRAESARRLAEDRLKHLRQKAARADGADLDSIRQELFDEESALPEVPKGLRLWCQDITPEKLGQLMADHGEKMAVLSDEGGLFDILGGRYSQGVPNLDLFLQAHSGAPYRVDRGSRPPVFLERPAITIALSPQPDVLRGLGAHPSFRGRGLVARFLYALPASTLGHRTLIATPLSPEVRRTYSDHLHALLALPARDDAHPHIVRMSEAARQEWKAFQRHVEDGMRPGGTFEHIRDWASKLPGAAARLAGVLHCADQALGNPSNTLVSVATMEAALTLSAILEQHALATFGLMAADSTLDAARRVWAWIARQRQPRFTACECFNAVRGTFPTMEELRPVLTVLIERNYLFVLPAERRVGRPSVAYRVHRSFEREWAS